MNDLTNKDSHFAFGKNWLEYAEKIDEPRILQAMSDLQRLNNGAHFDGKSFLDIGCGSGIHALAALRLGAARVTCVDIDEDSVEATKRTLSRYAPDAEAQVMVESVFDMSPERHGRFDVVYSWGVLHHTGDMYRAITLAANLVSENGIFIIALYRKTPFCGMWRHIKRWYSQASQSKQKKFMNAYLAFTQGLMKLRGVDVEARIANYGQSRGMDYYNDVHDWLGGYPYESITADQCRDFFAKRGFHLNYSNITKVSKTLGFFGSGCDEYTFKKS